MFGVMPEELKRLAEENEKLIESNKKLGRELEQAMDRIFELLQENDALREELNGRKTIQKL